MAKIQYIKDNYDVTVYPVTHERAVKDSNGVLLETKLAGKQDSLVSGTNIKTINNTSILGSGNLEVVTDISGKQDTLVSGTNIKTVNGNSLLGSGNIVAGDPDAVKYTTQSLTSSQQAVARENIHTLGYSYAGEVNPSIVPGEYATYEDLGRLSNRVDILPRGKNYGFFATSAGLPNDATEEGFAYVGATEPYAIWQFDGTSWTDSGVTANAFTADPGDVGAAVDEYLQEHPTVTGTFLYAAKQKLVRLLEKVAFVDEHGQDYINELSAYLFLSPIDHIEAVYTQGSTVIYDFSEFSEVENGLVVTVFFSDGNSAVTTDSELSGTLEGGTSSLTVSVLDRVTGSTVTDTFDVTVVGSTKLYVRGDECSAVTGGWQVKGFNLTNGSPVTQKASDHLLIKFNTSNNQASAKTFSTINKVDLSGKTKLIVRFKGYNNAGTGTLWCYWPATLSESTTQTEAFGSDYSSNRTTIYPYAPSSTGNTFEGQIETSLGTSRTEAYASLNLNVYNTYSAGAYAEIYVVALI